jgi:hypothetical protein
MKYLSLWPDCLNIVPWPIWAGSGGAFHGARIDRGCQVAGLWLTGQVRLGMQACVRDAGRV